MQDKFKKIIEELNNYELPKGNSFPDIDLYMDQVVTYLDRELKALKIEEADKLLTTSMINNYVKGGLLPSPDHKKYNKDHLHRLLIISSIKQILSISDIEELLNSQSEKNTAELYTIFTEEHKRALIKEIGMFNEFFKQVENFGEKELSDSITLYIIRLALHAEVQKILAEKLMHVLHEKHKEELSEQEKLVKEEKAKAKEDKKKQKEEVK